MSAMVITLQQAAPLAALGPCLFAVAFLLLVCRPRLQAIIPSLYFLSLAASFMMPLLPLAGYEKNVTLKIALMGMESLSPALCYLLVLELIYRRTPHYSHWFILAAPLVGGLPFVYGMLFEERICVFGIYCAHTAPAIALYHIFMAAFIFLLLIAHASRRSITIEQQRPERRHTYWLIITLISVHLALPIVDLSLLGGWLTAAKASILTLVLRLSFIYLVLTSLFRIYGSPLQVDHDQLPTLSRAGRRPLDDEILAERLVALMRHEAPYRKPAFNREELASMLKVSEQILSRVLNQQIGKNFNEFINEFRLEEAKSRLVNESGPINIVAYGVGFNSIASFNRVFKQSLGMSPTQYRQQNSLLPAGSEQHVSGE
jgi:AraC-like DNA-binding protein